MVAINKFECVFPLGHDSKILILNDIKMRGELGLIPM